MEIEFIYFDVGGVVTLDFSKTNKWEDMLADLGVREEDKDRLNKLFDVEEPKYCIGEKSPEEFVDILTNKFNLTLPDNYSYLDDFVSRFDPNPQLAEIIFELQNKYKLGLLTNMYKNMLDRLMERKLIPEVKWDAIIDSSKVGYLKPQEEIYKIAEQKAKTNPDKILFVENSKMHTDAAKKLGWNTLLYDPANVERSNLELTRRLA